MKLSELPRPYQMLAEYRREQQGGTSDELNNGLCFTWGETPECRDFWYTVWKGKYFEIPAASIRELVEAGKLKPGDVLEYVQQMFAAMCVEPTQEQVWKIVHEVKPIPSPDPVNSPAHYTQGSVEVFDMMLAIWGAEKVRTYCQLNAFKYRMRAGYKADAVEDVQKALWYESKAKEI